MSVLEAWSYKLPVLMTEACNIPEGFAANAALKLELNVAQISNQLARLNKLSETEFMNLSENGFDLVSNKFTWPFIAKQMAHLYDWLLGKGDRPEFVYLD
jgi:poly(glycerol-phosphate) alpha-glucosyltransferase